YPDGIARKYIGRLRHEVERAYNKLETPAPEIVFDPWARYVVPAFPFDILPPLVQHFVSAEAAAIGCDPSALAMCTLGTFSGALHHDIALKMLRNGNWYASPAPVAASGRTRRGKKDANAQGRHAAAGPV